MSVIFGVITLAIGLFGLGFALSEMMTHAAEHSMLKMVGGLAVFVVMSLLTLRAAN